MDTVKRTKTEYGGFLPLELNPGQEYFTKYENSLCRFNSVKAALRFLIRSLGKKRIYIPYYYCPSTTEAIRRTGIDVRFYHVDEQLAPQNIPDEESSIVLLVDYFGVQGDLIKRLADTYHKSEVIIDRAHAFYEEPIITEHIHNVYSAKKFFGIPDGAYLISSTVVPSAEMPTVSHDYAEYLLVAYEEGTNAAYTMKKDADKRIADDYNYMSSLAIGLLQNVDYERVKEKRQENYSLLFDSFKDTNELTLPPKCAAYQFPLLISQQGKAVKDRLVKDKIFVSTLWSGDDLLKYGSAFELNMSRNAVFLPVDQRYDQADVRYIVSRVKEYIENER